MWDKSVQGHILGSFFYGYLVSQIPGGLLAERFGAKWIIAGFLGLSTVATLLTPVASHISFVLLIVLRVLCGIGSVRFILITVKVPYTNICLLVFNPSKCNGIRWLHVKLFSAVQV